MGLCEEQIYPMGEKKTVFKLQRRYFHVTSSETQGQNTNMI